MGLTVFIFIFGFAINTGSIHGQNLQNCNRYSQEGNSNFFDCFLRDVQGSPSELIVLLDTSGSMGRLGFRYAKDFINSLLTNVRIEFSATRIALGTFSTHHKIDVNYILNPSYTNNNNNCGFKKALEKIVPEYELTNIKGALQDAYNVFREVDSNPEKHFRRAESKKVVLLIADGFNYIHGQGVSEEYFLHEVNLLKSTGNVILYTVAVTPFSDRSQLQKAASYPSSYLYASSYFELSMRAEHIRPDPNGQEYSTQNEDHEMCFGCDPNAVCKCNLKTKSYECLCLKGYHRYHGAGCIPCPHNTYGDSIGLINACKFCPHNSETSGQLATDLTECVCKVGYSGIIRSPVDVCKPITCGQPPAVSNAVIRNLDICRNSGYRTVCLYVCNNHYRLKAGLKNSIQCLQNGKWEQKIPACEAITCPANVIEPSSNDNYNVTCSTFKGTKNLYNAGTTCTFNCKDKYYKKSGEHVLSCLNSGQWNGSRIQCEAGVTFKVRSEGCDDPGISSHCGRSTIFVNGKDYSPNGRGINLVALNARTGKYIKSVSHDWYGDGSACNQTYSWVSGLSDDSIVLTAYQDEATNSVTSQCIQALMMIGGTHFQRDYHGSYVLIGYKGTKNVTWIQENSSPRFKGPTEISGRIFLLQ